LKGSPDIAGANKCWTKLRFPFSKMYPAPAGEIARGWFEVDFAYENYKTDIAGASYVLRNFRVVSPDSPVYVFDIKTFVNGTYHSEYGEAYRMVDTVVDKAQFGLNCRIPAAPTPFDPNSIGSGCIPLTQALFSTSSSASGILQETAQDTISFSFEYL